MYIFFFVFIYSWNLFSVFFLSINILDSSDHFLVFLEKKLPFIKIFLYDQIWNVVRNFFSFEMLDSVFFLFLIIYTDILFINLLFIYLDNIV